MRPHLFVRDNGNDVIRLGELRLDADNGYRTGTGGDFDGDGRDEIAIMRDSRIRIYTEPERSAEKVDFDVSTNSALIRAGNLDANGLADASRFAASPGMISDALPTGAVSAEHSVALSDAVNDRSFQFFVDVEDGAEWVRWTVSSSRTPAVLGVVFDAAGLPAGQYTERLVIDSDSEAVINTPVTVDLSLTVRDGLVVYPAEIVVPLHDCSEGAGAVQVQVAIDGTPGTGYAATRGRSGLGERRCTLWECAR